MLFPTAEYGLFFLACFAAAWGLRRRLVARKWFLLAASYAFYSFGEWRFLPLLIGVSLLAALIARQLQVEPRPGVKKALLTSGIAAVLSTLAIFKYLGFAATTVAALLGFLGLSTSWVRLPEIALPVGLSFFVFHAISLMVDTWRGKIPVRVTVLDSLLYVAFFPQLVAGPIVRASSFLPQLAAPPDPEAIDGARALELIVAGLVKKTLIANFLATRLVDPVFESPSLHGGLEALLAVYGYAVQIYCDFSGYTDIAIGSALLLGYRFPENFDSPYLARSPQEFWRRWHLSLSSWLRDYLFIPLGGSRRGETRTGLNLAITMVLGGLWHGAAWTFVAWGALHGSGLLVHRRGVEAGGAVARLRASRGWPLAAQLLTFHFVCLGWILFRSPTLEIAAELLGAIGLKWAAGLGVAIVAIVAGLLGHVLPARLGEQIRARFARQPLVLQGATLAFSVLLLEAFGPQGVAPFIYFRF